MKKAIAMLLATVMCTAMLTGCGSDSATNESSQAAESQLLWRAPRTKLCMGALLVAGRATH